MAACRHSITGARLPLLQDVLVVIRHRESHAACGRVAVISNLDGQTDDADTLLIRGNFGVRRAVKRSPRAPMRVRRISLD
jgi:hypothetical protein